MELYNFLTVFFTRALPLLLAASTVRGHLQPGVRGDGTELDKGSDVKGVQECTNTCVQDKTYLPYELEPPNGKRGLHKKSQLKKKADAVGRLVFNDTGCKTQQSWQDDIDSIVTRGYPGVVASIDIPEGTYTIISGYGNLESRTKVPAHAHFRIGSFTKPFVAVVALQLVGEGKMTLNDTVEKWLPGLLKGGFDGNRITLRQLLQHTSGLPDYTGHLPLSTEELFLNNRYNSWTPTQLIEMAVRDAPQFAPGDGWSYTSTGYIIVGMVIDKVTGNSWRDEVRNRIISPLGLLQTTIPGETLDVPTPSATGYGMFQGGDGSQGRYIDVTRLNPSCAGAAGEIISTAEDGNQFLKALIGGNLLKPAQLEEMQTTVPAPGLDPLLPNARYGLGIVQANSDCGLYWTHYGDIWGYGTRNGISSDGQRSIVLSVNSRPQIEKPGAISEGGPDLASRIINNVLCRN